MRQPTPKMMERLRAAAEWRAGGASWETVATRLGCNPGTCRSWPSQYRPIWRQLYQAAVKAVADEARDEARVTLRQQLRAGDAKTQLAAAQALLKARPKPGRATTKSTPADDALSAFLTLMRGLDDGQLEALLADYVADQPKAGGSFGGTPSPPSASLPE
jgi:transposase-like protein